MILDIAYLALILWCGFFIWKTIPVNPAVGFLLSGIALGPIGLNLLKNPSLLDHMGHIGLMIFMFIVGLEMPLNRIKSLYKSIFGLGFLQVAITTGLFYAVLNSFFHNRTAFIVSLALSFSSTAIIIETLSERSEKTSKVGRKALSILIFQDIAAILLFVYLGIIFPSPYTTHSIYSMIFGAVGLCVTTYIMHNITCKIFSYSSQISVTVPFVLFLVFFFTWITHQSGLSDELGPFVAGIILASTHWRHQITADIHPFFSVFFPLFFVSTGASIHHLPSLSTMPWIFVSLLLIIAIKMFGMLLALSFFKIEKEQRLALAALTTGCSEFVLIVLPSLRPVLGIDIANGIFFSVIVSMVLTPLFFSWAKKMMPKKNQSSSDIKIEPVVVVGFGTVGKSVAHILETNMIPFTIIDYKQTAVNQALEKGFLAMHGNINDMDFIKRATISDAKTLLLTFSKKNTPTLVRHLRSMMPLVSLCVKINKDEEAEQLIGLGAQIVFPETTRLGIQMVSHALKNIGFSEDNVEKMIHIKKERNVFE